MTTPTTLTVDRSPNIALALAIICTLLPAAGGAAMIAVGAEDGGDLLGGGIALAALGLAIGPSAGHFYAGEIGRGALTAAARAGLILAGFGGIAFAGLVALFSIFDGDEDATGWMIVGFVAATACGLAAITVAIFDMVDAGDAVRRRSRRRLREQQRRRGLASLQIVPIVATSERQGSLVGLSAAMRF